MTKPPTLAPGKARGYLLLAAFVFTSLTPFLRGDDASFAAVAKDVNRKMVKIFGAGGFRGVNAYCTGVLISPDGYILTVFSPTLNTEKLRVR